MNTEKRKRLRELRGDTNLRWVKGDRVGEPSFIMEVDDSLSPEEFLAQTGGSVADSICHTDAEVVVEFFNAMPDLLDDVDRLEAENASLLEWKRVHDETRQKRISELAQQVLSRPPSSSAESIRAGVGEHTDTGCMVCDGGHVRLCSAHGGDNPLAQPFWRMVTELSDVRDENAALKARVAVLEKVREAAEEVSYKYSDDYSEDNLRWNELIGALADADALDLANKENQ